MMEDEQNSSHYQSIDIASFRQTIMEKARQGRVPDHDVSNATKRVLKSYDVNGSSSYGNFSFSGPGSISDTPPNTPSSGESSTSLDLSSSRKVKISPTGQVLRDSIKNAARVPNADPSLPQISPRGQQNYGNGHNGYAMTEFVHGDENNPGAEHFWVGQRLAAERQLDTKTPMLRSYWEERERTEQHKQAQFQQQRRRPFGFPKWRSNDPMTASLVASKRVTELIPKDSRIPRERIQKLEEKERQAEVEKRAIHQNTELKPNLQKGKSLDSLNMQLDYQPWYDRQRIREAISRESIANIGATRDKFERNTPSTPSRHYHQYANDYSRQRAQSTTPYSQRQQQQTDTGYRAITPSAESEPSFVQNRDGRGGQNFPSVPAQNSRMNFPTPDPSNNLSAEHYYLLQFIKQNQSLFSDFGISIPKNLLNIADELPSIPVELKSPEEGRQQNLSRLSNRSPFQSSVSPTQQSIQTPVLHVPPTPQKNGRYVKNMTGNYQQRFRRLYDVSSKAPPENKKESFQEIELHKAGDSLIAAEIRAMREREEELRREREEREKWFQQFDNHDYTNLRPLRSAISYDQLNQNGQNLSKHKMNSTDELRMNETNNGQRKNPIWVANGDGTQKNHNAYGPSTPYSNITESEAEIQISSGMTEDNRYSF
uniref:Uncharacterized protein n=1 Tax=Acrobeloides nanus TaxID=290746 RepID=A0A914C8T0_9BILA